MLNFAKRNKKDRDKKLKNKNKKKTKAKRQESSLLRLTVRDNCMSELNLQLT